MTNKQKTDFGLEYQQNKQSKLFVRSDKHLTKISEVKKKIVSIS